MAKRNQHVNMVADFCNICGEDKGTLIVARTAKFKAKKKHSSGPCPGCQARISEMAVLMEQGGVMVVCTQCRSVNVQMEIPETLQKFVTELPYGGKSLEIAGCPLCTKENTNDTQPEVPGPDLDQQPGL